MNAKRRAKQPQAPRHLRAESKAWFRSVAGTWVLDADRGDYHLLTLACEALDRVAAARDAILRDGEYIAGRYGPKPHPALREERASRESFAALLKQLALDAGDGAKRPVGRPVGFPIGSELRQ